MPNGTIYEGKIENGKFNGPIEITYHDGRMYKGAFMDN